MKALRRSLLLFAVAFAFVVGCGSPPAPAPPAPASLTLEQAAATPPESLCRRYAALAEAEDKLDAKAKAAAERKCLDRAIPTKQNAPDAYACLVQCTFKAQTRSKARECKVLCRDGGSLETDDVLPPPH
jgi:hypothetical protein